MLVARTAMCVPCCRICVSKRGKAHTCSGSLEGVLRANRGSASGSDLVPWHRI